MTRNFLKEHWGEIKPQIKAQWTKLSDQDVELIHGESDMLVGNLQAAYGWSKEEATQELNEFAQLHLGHPVT